MKKSKSIFRKHNIFLENLKTNFFKVGQKGMRGPPQNYKKWVFRGLPIPPVKLQHGHGDDKLKFK